MKFLRVFFLVSSVLLVFVLASDARSRFGGCSGGGCSGGSCSGGSCGPGGCSGGSESGGYFSGGCGPNGCSAPADPDEDSPRLIGADSPLHWVKPTDPADAHRIYLFKGNTQVGAWDYTAKIYRPYHSHLHWWGIARQTAPIDPPVQPVPAPAPAPKPAPAPMRAWQLNGVDREKMSEEPGYSINGKSATRWDVYDALLDDDSGKLWLLVIGTDDQRKKLTDDLASNAQLAALKAKTRVWSVGPTHFSLMDRTTKQPMFDLSGTPSIYLLGADGDLLDKKLSYAGPEDLRKIDPAVKKQEDDAAAAAQKKKADDAAAAQKKKADADAQAAAEKKKADEAALKKPSPNTPGTPNNPLHMCGGAALAGTVIGTVLLILKGK